jgi:hypothetical protein
MDSSSDSDDDLLMAVSTFASTRTSRAQDKTRADMLSSMLKDSDRAHARFSRTTQMKREMKKGANNLDDDELRAQVLQASQKTAVSRQETRDALEGIVEDDNGDNGDGVLDRGRRRELMQAFDTDRSTCLGARYVIAFDSKRFDGASPNSGTGSIEFYHTHAQAMQALEQILVSMENGMDTNTANTDVSSQKGLQALVKSMRVAVNEKVLHHLLQHDRLVRLLDKHNVEQLPLELTTWLYRLVQSADLESRSLATLAAAALSTLVSLLDKKRICRVFWTETASLENLGASLECWVALDEVSCKQSNSSMDDTGMDDISTTTQKARTNVAGLDHLLQFWEHVAMSPTYRCAVECRLEKVTGCIAALARLGLDSVVTSSKVCINLRRALQRIISNLLEMGAAVAEKENMAVYVQWMKTTATAVLRDLSDLGPGDPGSEDKDDNKAWLCHSLIVRLFSSVDSNDEPSRSLNEFKAILSIQALEICLRVDDMQKKVKRVLNETGNLSILGQAESSLGWLSITSAYAALVEVDMANDDIAMDGPRCLATVECSFSAFQAGMLFLSSDSGWGSAAEYGDEAQAASIAHMVGLLELQCQQLCKRVAPMANNPHFRRVDYNLICCRQQYRFMKERASRLSGTGERNSFQGGMDQFVTRSESEAASPVGG